jgi:protein-tyrosine phosphatase
MMASTYGPISKATGMTDPEIRRKMELRPELIQIFFRTITEKYGSIENFMEKEMGIGKNEIKVLKSKYTI